MSTNTKSLNLNPKPQTLNPERFYAGRFDIIGHSHQLWHIAVLAGALEFYSAMQAYGEYRQVHACLA
jgi:adiponectin receptor